VTIFTHSAASIAPYLTADADCAGLPNAAAASFT
jgi:hypothetical protein